MNNNKKTILFMGPVSTRSGYGDHCRDLLKSLFSMDKFDICVISIGWGNCPVDGLNPNNTDDKRILDSILTSDLNVQPDIFMQCTVPNEFQRIGKFNIGITAGIETDTCSAEWLNGLNRMDYIIVPSEHSRYVFQNTHYEKRNKQTNQIESIVRCEREIEVLFEGIDTSIYSKGNKPVGEINEILNTIPEKFCFLFVGHWIKGGFGQDRKDISGMIKTFLESFSGIKNKPALILKTSGATFSIRDKDEIERKIDSVYRMVEGNDLPNVYLIHGDLTKGEMNTLYNHDKVKSFVSYTKGEGFGRPLLEFASTGKPIITTNWSGHIDFLNSTESVLLSGELKQIDKSAVWDNVLIPESKWFNVNYDEGMLKFKDVFNRYIHYKKLSSTSAKRVRDNYSLEKMTERFSYILDNGIKIPEDISKVLPKLERV